MAARGFANTISDPAASNVYASLPAFTVTSAGPVISLDLSSSDRYYEVHAQGIVSSSSTASSVEDAITRVVNSSVPFIVSLSGVARSATEHPFGGARRALIGSRREPEMRGKVLLVGKTVNLADAQSLVGDLQGIVDLEVDGDSTVTVTSKPVISCQPSSACSQSPGTFGIVSFVIATLTMVLVTGWMVVVHPVIPFPKGKS